MLQMQLKKNPINSVVILNLMTNIYIFATSFKVGVINGYSTFSKLHRIFFWIISDPTAAEFPPFAMFSKSLSRTLMSMRKAPSAAETEINQL